MSGPSIRWDNVSRRIQSIIAASGDGRGWLNPGQQAGLQVVSEKIPKHGLIIADEVGMGKTRIAVAVAKAVSEEGGRVAVIIPPGLSYQWQDEMKSAGLVDVPSTLRSIQGFASAWQNPEDSRPWSENPVVLISKNFGNWRISRDRGEKQRQLLSAIHAAWKKKTTGRAAYITENREPIGELEARIADSIIQSISAGNSADRRRLDQLVDTFDWDSDYEKGSTQRGHLEYAVGMGLGQFDLIIIDEAHKERGHHSGLSTTLNLLRSSAKDGRRICLTATPIELRADQWDEPLSRIGLEDREVAELRELSGEYAAAVRRVRVSWRGSARDREKFELAAKRYERGLGKYVIRRDKRDDEAVLRYVRHAGPVKAHYRLEREVGVELSTLSSSWKRAVCALEAVSAAPFGPGQSHLKRLRITLGSGHGLAALFDRELQGSPLDPVAKEDSQDVVRAQADQTRVDPKDLKRRARMEWWLARIQGALGGSSRVLYEHPGILEAVKTVESYTEKGEKVLVFGTYIVPMRALTLLLNARCMIRRIHAGVPWPQAKIYGPRAGGRSYESEWPAVRAAWSQLSSELNLGPLDEAALASRIRRQYLRIENSRERFRRKLLGLLSAELKGVDHPMDGIYLALFEELKDRASTARGKPQLAAVSRAMADLVMIDGEIPDRFSPGELSRAFQDLMDAGMDREGDEDSQGEFSDDGDELGDPMEVRARTAEKLDSILLKLKDEFSRTQGGYARLMYGETSPHSRRLIQQGFNRKRSFPRVLVAQSTVGREGLNLHRACKTVLLLHPEWNPAVVEQQLGRVDRVGSHWCTLLNEAIEASKAGADLPRIEFLALVFKGTYDEHHWRVLRERWDDLRSQLHGQVIPQRERTQEDQEGIRIIEELDAIAPNFSPNRNRS